MCVCVFYIEHNAMISGNDIKGTNDVDSTATGECNITGLKYTFTIIDY